MELNNHKLYELKLFAIFMIDEGAALDEYCEICDERELRPEFIRRMRKIQKEPVIYVGSAKNLDLLIRGPRHPRTSLIYVDRKRDRKQLQKA